MPVSYLFFLGFSKTSLPFQNVQISYNSYIKTVHTHFLFFIFLNARKLLHQISFCADHACRCANVYLDIFFYNQHIKWLLIYFFIVIDKKEICHLPSHINRWVHSLRSKRGKELHCSMGEECTLPHLTSPQGNNLEWAEIVRPCLSILF